MKVKRIFSVLLSLSIAMAYVFIPHSANAAGVSDKAVEAYEILGIMGFIDDGIEPESLEDTTSITRAEFVDAAYKVFGEGRQSAEPYFHDLPISHYVYRAVSAFVDAGYISTNEERLFYPDIPMKKQEAAKIICYALGYKSVCDANGGYPGGVDKVASSLKLYSGTSSGSEFNYADMLIMLYNALLSEVMEYRGSDSKGIIMESTGETYLSSKYNMYVSEGIVSGFDETSAFGDPVKRGHILIGDVEMPAGDVDAAPYLGMYVKYIYDYTDKDPKLVWLKPTKRSETLTLNIFDNDFEFNADNNTFKFYDSNGREKTARLEPNISVVVNGAFASDGIADILGGEPYSIRLVATDGGKYNLAIIEDYENYTLSAAPGGDVMYVKSCDGKGTYSEINIARYDRVNIYDETGGKTELKNIKIGSVVSVFETPDKSRLKIAASPKTVTGKLTAAGNDAGYQTFTIDDETYKVYKRGILYDVAAGKSMKLSLDTNGYVANAEYSGGATKFGYLINIYYDDIEEQLILKMCDQSGTVKKYGAAEILQIDETSCKNNPEKAYYKLGGPEFDPVLIAYTVNDNDEIKSVDMPQKAGTYEKSSKNMLTIDESSADANYDGRSAKLGYKIRLGGDTVVFNVPEDPSKGEDEYSVGDVNLLEHDNTYSYTAYSYGMEDKEFIDAVTTSGDLELIKFGASRVLIDKIISEINDDGEIVTAMDGYISSRHAHMQFAEDISDKALSLKRGDIIRIRGLKNNNITGYDILYNSRTGSRAENMSYRLSGSRTVTFYVHDVIGTTIKAGFNSGADFDEVFTQQSAPIYVYDRNADIIENGSLQDMISYKIAGDDCSFVFLYMINARTEFIVVYK